MPLLYDILKECTTEQLQHGHPRDDYREFLQLLGIHNWIEEFGSNSHAWCPSQGALDGDELVIQLMACELQGI